METKPDPNRSVKQDGFDRSAIIQVHPGNPTSHGDVGFAGLIGSVFILLLEESYFFWVALIRRVKGLPPLQIDFRLRLR